MQMTADAGLELRAPVTAGPHGGGVPFVTEQCEPEGLPQPLPRGRVLPNDQVYMDYPSVGSVQIGGPYQIAGSAADTPSRRALFICSRRRATEERPCATKILSRLARLAYRRPGTGADVDTLVEFFDNGRRESGSF